MALQQDSCENQPVQGVATDQLSQLCSMWVEQADNNNNLSEETDNEPFQDSGSSFHPSSGSEDESQSEIIHNEHLLEDENESLNNQSKKKRAQKRRGNPDT